MERAKQLGGAGTPAVAEFACAELGVLMGTSPVTAENLVRDAVDLRHRHPHLWAALADGRARVWKARKVAHLTHAAGLSLDQARAVDAAVTPYVDALAWKAFTDLVEARIIEADPAAAEARRVAESLARFVSTGQSDEFGLKTLIVKATAGDVIFFVAMSDRIAACLLADGDNRPGRRAPVEGGRDPRPTRPRPGPAGEARRPRTHRPRRTRRAGAGGAGLPVVWWHQ